MYLLLEEHSGDCILIWR